MVCGCVIVVVGAVVVVDVEAVDSIVVLVVGIFDASVEVILVDCDGVMTDGRGVFYKIMQIKG